MSWFLPFTLSPAVKKLLEWRQDDEDAKWAEKAINLLIKKLSSKLESIEELQRALENPSHRSNCITIPRTLDGRLQVANRKMLPHVIYCRIWRWPDLQNQYELMPTDACVTECSKNNSEVCINPYHYYRVVTPILPPVVVQRKPQCSSKGYSIVPSYLKSQEAPRQDETQVHFQEIECWSTIQYYELNQKVGLPFKPATMQAYVNGYTDTVTKDRLSLGSLTNTSRNEKTESARRHIGHGVQLSYVCGELFVDCLSDYAVFIQSKIVARALGLPPLSVMKLPPGGSTKIFSTLEFSKLLHETVADGYKATFDLTNFCSVYLSFIKGWGPEYHRQTVNGTPCWMEIQMHGPLVWLDKVLIELGPTTKITSKS